MSEQINDGGPAFPQLGTAWNADGHCYELSMSIDGMSLRDYFAAKALTGVHAEYLVMLDGRDCTRDDYHNIAADAYTLADAMLKARKA